MLEKSIGIFGEVLFDCFADGSRVLGGAPFNVAWHLQAFAQQPLFFSRIGKDEEGSRVRQAMADWGMDCSGLQVDSVHPTGQVQVTIEAGEPQYAILDNQAYDFINSGELPPQHDYRLLYHGSLALRNAVSRQTFSEIKRRHRGDIFMDVNLRAPWWRQDEIEAWLADADWVKLNVDELQRLVSGSRSVEDKMAMLIERFALKGLVVTCGDRGALARSVGQELIKVAPTEKVEVVDCVGAGDAFAAVLMMGIVSAWPLPLTLRRAQAFASALVGQRGATVSDIGFYQPFVNDWQ